jgi:poly-gamma-glutamate synthesis protein (capsule biosynthesis protein)
LLLPIEPISLVSVPVEGPTLALVGDVMLGRGVGQALEGDWGAAFAEVRPWLAGADVAFANLESPLTTAPQVREGYDLRADPESVAALRVAGFDVVSLANNHVLDAGEAGLVQTVATLEAAGLLGLARAQPQRRMEADASAAWSSVSLRADLSGCCFLAFDDSVHPLDVEAASRLVAAAAGQSDVVVVSVHWGGEYQAAPSPRQRAIASALAGAGAGLIVGHGPHVLQRLEWVGGTLVVYSLGNFLFDQPYPADCRQGAILSVRLRGGRVAAVEAVPTVAERGRVRLAELDEASAILARLGMQSASLQIGRSANRQVGRSAHRQACHD